MSHMRVCGWRERDDMVPVQSFLWFFSRKSLMKKWPSRLSVCAKRGSTSRWKDANSNASPSESCVSAMQNLLEASDARWGIGK